jgi:hypothetical protein
MEQVEVFRGSSSVCFFPCVGLLLSAVTWRKYLLPVQHLRCMARVLVHVPVSLLLNFWAVDVFVHVGLLDVCRAQVVSGFGVRLRFALFWAH